MNESIENQSKHPDIDERYAWVILVSTSTLMGILFGTRQGFGVLYPQILDMYQAGQYRTSWIITIQVIHFGLMGKTFVFFYTMQTF